MDRTEILRPRAEFYPTARRFPGNNGAANPRNGLEYKPRTRIMLVGELIHLTK